MPHQNRVTPFGDIVAIPERGTFTGNRGILHDEHGNMTHKRWTNKAWIACVLEYKGIRRKIMSPHTWTELFFLDEATALSAGHRPCGECRRADFKHFKALWRIGNQQPDFSLSQIDQQLHTERVSVQRTKQTYETTIDGLPEGTMIVWQGDAHLLWQGTLYRWSAAGYQPAQSRPKNQMVTVLTPRSIVNTLMAGYVPKVHMP
jgi:hypothetical protein